MNWFKKTVLFFLVLSAFSSFSQSEEQLILFIGNDSISEHFISSRLNKIKTYTDDNGIELITKQVSDGAPEEVNYVPSIFYQNYRGRSLYSGRYLTVDRLINFIRTVKYSPRKETANVKTLLPVWQNEKMTLGTPIKVTDLGGALPKDFNQQEFKLAAQQAILQGMSKFKAQTNFNLPIHARLFYTDYYPYLSDDGKLYVSTAIFSMFHCHEAVYQSKKPVVGDWNNRHKLFNILAAEIEQIVISQLTNLTYGDAVIPVSISTTSADWKELDLSLPAKQIQNKEQFELTGLPLSWEYESALPDGSPIVQFNFGSPVDHYSGEAKEMRMQLELSKKSSLKGAKGHVVVRASSITMGDPGLDDYLFSDVLKTGVFTNAHYNFEIIEAPAQWDYVAPQPIRLKGVFEMLGQSTPLESGGTIEVVIGTDGQPKLQVNGNFILPTFEIFGIEGPDGPSPAKDELNFQLNLLMKPTEMVVSLTNNLFSSTKDAKNEASIKRSDEEYIKWRASTKLYKAKGTFEDWKFTKLALPNMEMTQVEAGIEINIHAIYEKSKLLVKHLKGENFFDAESYPTATVVIHGAKKIDSNNYKANAIATIKDVTASIPLNFEIINMETLEVVGTALVEREKFGVGTHSKAKSISKVVELEFRAFLKNRL